MSSIKSLAGRIISTAGYIFYGSVAYAWKKPWDDAATKGRIPIKPELGSKIHYTIAEAHNIIDYSYDFLENLRFLSITSKALNRIRPKTEPSIFVYPLFDETQKEGIIPAHDRPVKKWIFFTRKETVQETKIKIPYYRIIQLHEILSKGSQQQAWCAQIILPARHGKKAVESEIYQTRDHNITLTIIANKSICMELANLTITDAVALYHEILPHWYDYETPTGKGKLQITMATETELNKEYDAVAKEMQNPAALYSTIFD